MDTGKSCFHYRDLFCSVVAFDVKVESYILNLQTIGKKQLSFIHFFADITEFITFSWISKAIPYTILWSQKFCIRWSEASQIGTYLSQDHPTSNHRSVVQLYDRKIKSIDDRILGQSIFQNCDVVGWKMYWRSIHISSFDCTTGWRKKVRCPWLYMDSVLSIGI